MSGIDLRDKPICITGASAGIGRATAIDCAKAGMPVMAAARRVDRLEELASRIRSAGGRVETIACDVADPEQCRRMIEATEEAFGPIYAVFANAGVGLERPVHEMNEDELRRIFEVNFFGTMHTLRPAIPRMLERGEGHALICSSCLAKFALPYYGAYTATKAAQNHIGRAMRLELEPVGVHVSTVHPIGTRTEFFEITKRRSGSANLLEHAPDRFMQPPEKVARAVVACLRRPKPEVWTSRLVRFGMAVSLAFPRLADMGVRNMVRKRLAEAPEHSQQEPTRAASSTETPRQRSDQSAVV